MSTRDMLNFVSEAYKGGNINAQGHNLFELGRITGSYTFLHPDSILPQCGPLLFINEDEITWTTGVRVYFQYQTAVHSGWQTGFMLENISYQYKLYSGEYTTYSDSVYFESGTRQFSQILFTGNQGKFIHKLIGITGSNQCYDVRCYSLADDGSRMLYAWNTEKEREVVERLTWGHYIAPPLCPICTGSHYQSAGTVCTNCNGYGYVGYNAKDYVLTRRIKDFGVEHRDESDESVCYRAWAKRAMLMPTYGEIRRYFAHFTRLLNTGYLIVESKYGPDYVFTVRIPFRYGTSLINDSQIGSHLSSSGLSLQEMVDDIAPAGVCGRVEPFSMLLDDDTVINYDEDYFEGMRNVDLKIPMMPRKWGAYWGTSWAGWDKYFQADSGIIYMAGSGIWSGETLTGWDNNYFTGMRVDNYSGYYLLDCPYAHKTTRIYDITGISNISIKSIQPI